MRKILFVILLGFGLVNTGLAQQYFNIRNQFHSSSTVLTAVAKGTGKYYIAGLCVDSSNYVNPGPTVPVGIKFLVLDSYGNKLVDTFYQKSDQETIEPWNSSSLYLQPDGTLLLAAQYYDTTIWKALVMKFDSVGHLLWEKQYDQPFCNDHTWYKVTDFKPTGTGEWLLLGDVVCTPWHNVMTLTKLDSNFNVIWTNEYGNPPKNHVPSKVIIDQNGYLISGTINDLNVVANGSYFQPELIRVDTSGATQWTWVRNSGGYYMANDVLRTKDGGYVYCGQSSTQVIMGDIAWHGWIEKLDSGRNVVWNKTISAEYSNTDYNQLNVVRELQDSSVVIAGSVTGGYDPQDSTNDFIYGGLIHLKSDGAVIWEREYKVAVSPMAYYFYDMKPTDDGGYIMVGQAIDLLNHYGPPTQRGWIVKVDSSGCVDPTNCDATAVKELLFSGNDIKVYPNPAHDLLYISYSHIARGKIAVLDITGRQLIEKDLDHSVDISGLAKGLYIYRIADNGTIKAQGKFVKE